MLRILGNLLMVLWMWLVRGIRFICRRKETDIKGGRGGIERSSNTQTEWTTDWDGWEGVKVEEVPATVLSQEEETPDIFHDMEPNLQKTKKIKIKKQKREGDAALNLKQFAFDPAFKTTSSELLDWPDEEQEGRGGENGWEEDELPELLRQSKQSLRKQRHEAMEVAQRQQRERATNALPSMLGATKIT